VRRRVLAAVLGVAGAGLLAAILFVVLAPRAASAKAQSRIEPLAAAEIPPVFKSGIAASARRAGASPRELVEVGAEGDAGAHAGLVVGHNASGDLVSLFTSYSFTSFSSPGALLRGRSIAAYASIQPGPDGETGHVQLGGVASPPVTRAVLDLADGSTMELELVHAGRGPCTFFTYATDSKQTFPVAVHAYDGRGVEIGSYDLRPDIAAPRVS
jgi:hypothetical protein